MTVKLKKMSKTGKNVSISPKIQLKTKNRVYFEKYA